jgi:hypothetical protein
MGRIANAINDYQSRADKRKGTFKISDIVEIRNISEDDYILNIFNSLESGYQIGYRAGQKEQKEKNKNKLSKNELLNLYLNADQETKNIVLEILKANQKTEPNEK